WEQEKYRGRLAGIMEYNDVDFRICRKFHPVVTGPHWRGSWAGRRKPGGSRDDFRLFPAGKKIHRTFDLLHGTLYRYPDCFLTGRIFEPALRMADCISYYGRTRYHFFVAVLCYGERTEKRSNRCEGVDFR